MHFFIDHTVLPNQPIGLAYGPDAGTSTSLFNATSRFLLTNVAKAFACQAGQIVVLQSTANANFVNVILKPHSHLSIPYQNVSYYIYRGLLKNSFFNSNLKIVTDLSATELGQQVLKMEPEPSSDSYPASVVGYDNNTLPGNNNIESIFNHSSGNIKPISVIENEWFGNFGANEIGFEIILESDKINVTLDYVRGAKAVVDVGVLANLALRAKREEVLAFIDPAAFIGLHYSEGVSVSTFTGGSRNSTKLTGTDLDILIHKFYTKNRVYIDIRSEKGYSYNFYQNYKDGSNNNIKINSTQQSYQTISWPIIYFDATSHNDISLGLRIDDNKTPVVYIQNPIPVGKRKEINNFVNVQPGTGGWTKPFAVKIPGSITYAFIVKIYYFRQEYNLASPDSILKNVKYYDSAFCPIDLPNLGTGNLPNNSIYNPCANFIREPLQKNGTGNFSYVANNGAVWDNNRIILYSKLIRQKKNSGKMFLPTYAQKISIGGGVFDQRLDVICRSYRKILGGNPADDIKILGVNNYSFSATSNDVIKDKEMLILLGLTISEINAVKEVSGLSSYHHRYPYLMLTANSPYTDQTLNSSGQPNGNRFYEYEVWVQGLNESGEKLMVKPTKPGSSTGTPILVYTRDQLFFHSPGFSVSEQLTGNFSKDLNTKNQIEFHIYSDGNVKLNDNIDLALIYEIQKVFYKYKDLNSNSDLINICEVPIVKIYEVSRFHTTNHGFLPANPDPGGTIYTELVENYKPGPGQLIDTHRDNKKNILAKGSINGSPGAPLGWQLFLYQGRVTFMVRFPELEIPAIGIDFSYGGTQRKYAKPQLAAALIGAMADFKIPVVSAGLAFKDGNSFPSGEHVNGEAFDSSYYASTTQEVDFIKSLYKFGFRSFRIGPAKTALKNAVNAIPELKPLVHQDKPDQTMHNNHLHTSEMRIINNSQKTL
jgi:hypothetical protein